VLLRKVSDRKIPAVFRLLSLTVTSVCGRDFEQTLRRDAKEHDLLDGISGPSVTNVPEGPLRLAVGNKPYSVECLRSNLRRLYYS
jgi:hypothetical protein